MRSKGVVMLERSDPSITWSPDANRGEASQGGVLQNDIEPTFNVTKGLDNEKTL